MLKFLIIVFILCIFVAGFLAGCWWKVIEKPKKMAKKEATQKLIPNTQRALPLSKTEKKYEEPMGIGV